MFKTLFWKEIQEHIMTFRFAAALTITTTMVVLSIWTLGEDYKDRLDTFNALSEKYSQYGNEIIVPSGARPTVSKPPTPLEIFAIGQTRSFGNFITIERREVPYFASGNIKSNELLDTIPSIDLATILIFVGGLFSILMSYDSITSERANGTLKMILTGNISRSKVYLAKFLGLFLVSSFPVIFSMVASMLMLNFLQNISFSSQEWLFILIMLFATLVYISVMIAAGMFFSSCVKTSATSAILSFLFFVTSVYLVPLASAEATRLLIPSYTGNELRIFEQQSEREVTTECTRYAREIRPAWTETVIWSTMNMHTAGPYIVIFDGNPDVYKWAADYLRYGEPLWWRRADQVWKLREKTIGNKKRQADLTQTLSILSPSFILSTIYTSLANTDYSSQYAFILAAQKYRNQFLNNLKNKGYFSDNTFEFISRKPYEVIANDTDAAFLQRKEEYRQRWENRKPGEEWWASPDDPDFWKIQGELPEDLIPPFTYRPHHFHQDKVLVPLITLLFLLLLILTAGVFAFQKYDIREGN